jgi:polysaccharide pyruvyl transferase WcaK-like protein
MAKFKAIIRGAYGEGNFGDDVLMVVCHGLLRQIYQPDEIAFVFTSDPSESERRYAERLIPGINVIRFESEASAELVVWGGGTQFYSFPQSQTIPPLYQKVLTALGDPKKAMNFLRKKMFGGKFGRNQRFAALGVGIGPFVPGSPNETYSCSLFERMDFTAVRDPESLRLCGSWEVKSPKLRTDLCFLPEVCWSGSFPSIPPRERGRRIGLIVRDWPHDAEGAAYAKPLMDVAERLKGAGYEVRFVLFRAKGESDWAARLKVRDEAPLMWEPESQSIADFFRELARFDCFVSARYHGAIFAALLGKPMVCIEIEQKLRLVAELLQSRLWKQPFEDARCLELVDRIFNGDAGDAATLSRVVEDQQSLGQAMMTEFCAFAQNQSSN